MRRYIACLALVGFSLALAAPAIGAGPSYLIQINGAGPADLSGQVAAAGGTLTWVRPEIGYAAATSADPDFAGRLKHAGGVVSVDQDFKVQWAPTAQQAGVQTVSSSVASASAAPTSAFFYACQWNLAKIDAPGAWAKGFFGSPGVKVAVLD